MHTRWKGNVMEVAGEKKLKTGSTRQVDEGGGSTCRKRREEK